jgi:hypothetical protein
LRSHIALNHTLSELKTCETPRGFTENVIPAAAFTRAADARFALGYASCGMTG